MSKNRVAVGLELDKWRDYFRSSNSDIFSIIEHAIMVGAVDCPDDFKVKRDGIAEMLYTCRMRLKEIDGDGEFKTGGSKDYSKENNSSTIDEEHMEVNAKNRDGDQEDYDHDHDHEIEEESHDQFVEEVVRIKEVIDESEGKSTDQVLFESLRRLQMMPVSLEILKSTRIGRSVYALRNHGSKEIRNLGRRLVVEWRRMVDNAITKYHVEEEEQVACLGDSKTPSTMNSNKQNGTLIQKKPFPQQQQQQQEEDKSLNRVDQTRLEAAKRKLHQRYEEAENAKKRRMIQVVELSDLPQQSQRQRPQGRRC